MTLWKVSYIRRDTAEHESPSDLEIDAYCLDCGKIERAGNL
jgi:hypothetical protein